MELTYNPVSLWTFLLRSICSDFGRISFFSNKTSRSAMKDIHVSEDSEGTVVTLNLNFCVPPSLRRDLRGVLILDYLLNVGSPVSMYRNQHKSCLFFLICDGDRSRDTRKWKKKSKGESVIRILILDILNTYMLFLSLSPFLWPLMKL